MTHIVRLFLYILTCWCPCKGSFTNTCKRVLMHKKKHYREKFSSPPPLQPSKKLPPPLFGMKIISEAYRKACKLIFHWKLCGIFFQGPPCKGQTLKGTLFASGPLTNVCERSLTCKIYIMYVILLDYCCSVRAAINSICMSLTHWLTDSLIHWLTDSLTHWLTHSLNVSCCLCLSFDVWIIKSCPTSGWLQRTKGSLLYQPTEGRWYSESVLQ